MNLTQKLAHKSNYGGTRSTSTIKYIVIHYTANDGDKAWNNANYFQSPNRNASAHYFVDDNYVYQSVPDNYVAWSVGGAKYSDCAKTGGGKLYGKCTNSNSINIELCDTNKNGTVYPTQATINRAIELTKELMKKYNVPADRVVRHFDTNGKHCPAYWMDNSKWNKEFHGKLKTTVSIPTQPTYKSYQGGFPIIPPTLKKGSKGSQVQRLQKFLNWYGNYSLVVDGDFGTKTKNAVLSFQKKVFYNDSKEWDGIFGKKSLDKAKAVKK